MIDKLPLFALWIVMTVFWVWAWRITKTVQRHREQLLENEAWASWVERKLKEVGQSEEQRCQHCTEGPECPAYDTGCIYPCPYFKEVKADEEN